MGRVKGTPSLGESVVPDGLLDKLSTLRSGQSGASGAGDWWPASPSLLCSTTRRRPELSSCFQTSQRLKLKTFVANLKKNFYPYRMSVFPFHCIDAEVRD